MLLNGSSGEVLCKEIRGVRGSEHLKKSKGPLTQALLDPDSIKDQISFSYTTTNANNDGASVPGEPNVLAINGKFDESNNTNNNKIAV